MGAQPQLDRRCVRFGVFELNTHTGELRKHGVRVRLQDQPLKLLLSLLETPGEICTREDLIGRVWPEGTFVDYERGLNAAVTRLRQVMGDSADAPRYVETVGRKGYRFIAPVERIPTPQSVPAALAGMRFLGEPQTTPATIPEVANPSRLLRLWPYAAVLVFGLAAGGVFGWWRATRPVPKPLVRLNVDLEPQMTLAGPGNALALSPDGARLAATVRNADGIVLLATRRLDESQLTVLPGTEGASRPFFSPDGQWVAFFAGGKLKKISVRGGPAIALSNSDAGYGGSWSEDGSIIASLQLYLSRVPSAGGSSTPVTEVAAGEMVHRWPQVLPGGKAVLFSAYTSISGLDGASIEVISLKDRRRKTLVRGGTWGRYLPSGHLVYINQGSLLAVPFDPDRLEVRGTPIPVLEGVAYSTATGSAELDFSRTGALLYQSGGAGGGLVTVRWLDGSGEPRPLIAVPGNYLSPTIAPDGNRLALTSAGDILVYDLGRNTMTRLTTGGGYGNPLWSADGRYIVFRGARAMFWTRGDGTGNPEPLTQSKNQQIPWSLTGDGKRLAFVEVDPASGADIWTAPVVSDSSGLRAGVPEVFLQTPFQERTPMFSPDGRWLAYSSNESGSQRVYVDSFPRKGHKQQVSEDQANYPAWSRSGNELYFWHFGVVNQLMVASYKVQGGSFLPDKPRVWFEKKLASFSTTRSYDVAPDGKRIVALIQAEGPEVQNRQSQLIFLLNFFDELRRRVPTERK